MYSVSETYSGTAGAAGAAALGGSVSVATLVGCEEMTVAAGAFCWDVSSMVSE